MKPTPRVKVWVVFRDRVKFGDGRAELLDLIDRLGSIKKAVARTGMSYRAAWGYLRELEAAAGFKFLERTPGAGPRSGARLTKDAKLFLRRYRRFRRDLVGTGLGGVPMCHGAGGMAGHVRFGARTGGALVILGVLVLFTGLFLADSVTTLFRLFPPALLGVILMFGGLELAAGAHGNHFEKSDRYVVLLTAGIAMWNMGAGYLVGLVLWHAFQRGILRLDSDD